MLSHFNLLSHITVTDSGMDNIEFFLTAKAKVNSQRKQNNASMILLHVFLPSCLAVTNTLRKAFHFGRLLS